MSENPETAPRKEKDCGANCCKQEYFKIYEAIWRNMERENNLINYRNQWAIVLSGGILATQGVLLNAIKDVIKLSTDYVFGGFVVLLMCLLSCLAIFFCWKSSEGVLAAQNQLDYLLGEYNRFKSERCRGNLFEVDCGLPRPFGDPHDHLKGNVAAFSFPKVMLSIWILFALIQGVSGTILLSEGIRKYTCGQAQGRSSHYVANPNSLPLAFQFGAFWPNVPRP